MHELPMGMGSSCKHCNALLTELRTAGHSSAVLVWLASMGDGHLVLSGTCWYNITCSPVGHANRSLTFYPQL